MEAFSEQLARCLRGRVCVVGVGNAASGDDGFGVLLAERCRAMVQASWETPRDGLPMNRNKVGRALRCPPVGRGCCRAAARSTLTRLAGTLAPPGSWSPSMASGPRELSMDRPSGITIIEAGLNPERHLTRLMDEAFDHVLFVDAVDFGGSPGEVVLLDAAAMVSRWPQVSTHKLSLGLMARLIEGAGRARVHLLGVQPRCLNPGAPLSTELRAALDLLAALFQQALQDETEAASPAAHAGACRDSSGGLVPC